MAASWSLQTKFAKGDRYYQMSKKQRGKFLRTFHETKVTVIGTANEKGPTVSFLFQHQALVLFYSTQPPSPTIEIFDKVFNSAIDSLQTPSAIVECPGREGYLTKSKVTPNQIHHPKSCRNVDFPCD